MDPRPDPRHAGQVTTPDAQPEAVLCDQAVFTSARSPLGPQGYRIIAAGEHLSSRECSEIVTHAPSGDGLCDDAPAAEGLAFYRLSSGRCCVLHSRYAGKEPSGRGGRRTYTLAFVLDEAGFARFHGNPFEVVRAARSLGALNQEVTTRPSLPQLRLPCPPRPGGAASVDRSVAGIGARWISHLAGRLLDGQTIIADTEMDRLALAEAVVLVIPAPLRSSVSLAANLRFSVGRCGRLTVVREDVGRMRQLMRGREVWVERIGPDRGPPAPPDHPWAALAERFLCRGRQGRLLDLAAQFGPDDVAAIDRIVAACIDLDNMESASAAELVDTAAAWLDRRQTSPLERKLAETLLANVRERLESAAGRTAEEDLVDFWHELLALAEPSERAAGLAEPALLTALRRAARHGLPTQVQMLTAAARASPRAYRRLRTEAARVAAALVAWADAASPEEIAARRQLISAWAACAEDSALTDLLDRMRKIGPAVSPTGAEPA